jgi:hypothetical protein
MGRAESRATLNKVARLSFPAGTITTPSRRLPAHGVDIIPTRQITIVEAELHRGESSLRHHARENSKSFKMTVVLVKQPFRLNARSGILRIRHGRLRRTGAGHNLPFSERRNLPFERL